MRRRFIRLGGVVLALLTLAVIPATHVGATPPAPTCYDFHTQQHLTATKWNTEPGPLVGTNKRDVLVGSTGPDTIKGLGGNDVICTSPTDENLDIDSVEGGAGDDSIYGIAHADGGTGRDFIVVYWTGSTATGGPGNDVVVGVSGAQVDGGSGNDVVAGLGAGELLGGTGNDSVGSVNGEGTLMDCGTGTDTHAEDGDNTVRRCEKTTYICDFMWVWDWFLDASPDVTATDVSTQC